MMLRHLDGPRPGSARVGPAWPAGAAASRPAPRASCAEGAPDFVPRTLPHASREGSSFPAGSGDSARSDASPPAPCDNRPGGRARAAGRHGYLEARNERPHLVRIATVPDCGGALPRRPAARTRRPWFAAWPSTAAWARSTACSTWAADPASSRLAFAFLAGSVVAIDPEPEMLRVAAAAVDGIAPNVELVRGSSDDLSPRLGTFRWPSWAVPSTGWIEPRH